jgi:hypothetical protein
MSKRLLVAAAALSLLGVLGQGVAGAAPTPKYTVTCAVGDRTIARWQRASLSKVTFDWTAPPGSGVTYPGDSTEVSKRPSHGSVIVATPINPNPATATVTFTRADGSSTDVVTVSCS